MSKHSTIDMFSAPLYPDIDIITSNVNQEKQAVTRLFLVASSFRLFLIRKFTFYKMRKHTTFILSSAHNLYNLIPTIDSDKQLSMIVDHSTGVIETLKLLLSSADNESSPPEAIENMKKSLEVYLDIKEACEISLDQDLIAQINLALQEG